ncbi:MAG TPA: hypothetical protein VGO29_05740 [Solirubrobacteraceae bacterium]|jgi:Tol biopolymer transport system component|nr:hypothetical protein [Solirubrobacteraceae bacterium]
MSALARPCVVLVLLAAGLLGASAGAQADVFGPISLVSQSPTGQVDYAHDTVISGNARYVAFDGSYGGVTGVWRRDLLSGTIAQVAPGDAELPSISGDGQYVSFTTTAKLSSADENRGPDVYVRDLGLQQTDEGAFTLASAVTVEGSTRGLAYGYASEPGDLRRPFEEQHYGALASGRSALSADGREVVFVTTAASDLTDPQTPGEPRTPPLQVVMRNLETSETRLVSARIGSSDEPVSTQEGSELYGAVFTGQLGKAPAFAEPPAFGRFAAGPPLGASISADGSTVAWMGADVGQQAPLLSAEHRGPSYTEPLWRRVARGSETPTERVTGGSDPAASACIASGEPALGNSPSPSDPCQGPFATPEGSLPSGIWAGGGDGNFVPRLSADGYTVAFVARAQPVSSGEGFGFGFDGPSDLYVVNMRAGLTRDGALTRLTQLASGNQTDVATAASILDFGLSPDGRQVAFTTRRTQFVLGSPAYVTSPAAEAGMGELYDADLANSTLTRVTRGFEGGPSEHPHVQLQAGRDPYTEGDGALSPSFSADGKELAFASTASNLAYGDGNTPQAEGATFDGSDAFVVERQVFNEDPTPQYISPAPAGVGLSPAWRLDVTASARRDGSVVLFVRVPGAGALHARAKSLVRTGSPGSATHARRHSAQRGSVRSRRSASVVARTVATRSAYPHGEGLVTLTLKPAGSYLALASARGGLSATLSLSFAASHRPTLRDVIQVTFARTKKVVRRSKKASRR